MKRLLLVLVLIIGLFNRAFGQLGEYELQTVFSHNVTHDNFHCNVFLANAYFSDGTVRSIFERHGVPRGTNVTFTDTISYPANKNLTRLEFWGRRHTGSKCRKRHREDGGLNFEVTGQSCLDKFFSNAYGNAAFNTGSIHATTIPLLTILDPGADDAFPTDDPITIKSHTGFKASEYNWEYSFDLNTWISMPAYSGSANISLSANDLLGNNASDYHGQDIHIRQVACNYESTPVTYKVLVSAPKISSTISSNVSCYDSDDGTIKITFERPIYNGELLSITSSNDNFPSGNYANLITADLDSNNSININGLKEGVYTIAISGFINGFSTFTQGIYHNADFTINRPNPVEFTYTKTDV